MISEKLRKAREYEARSDQYITEDMRPLYHLSPRVGWMNDPNGFSFYQGKYHLFYQYYPYKTVWGPMHWGHAVSEDLLRWAYLPCAMAPDTEIDRDGCFSGSAVTLEDGRQLLIYTGVRNTLLEDGRTAGVQTQCLAFGDGLNYEKYEGNPVLNGADLPEGANRVDFRDPKVWRENGSWHMIVGNRPADGSGSLLIYTSEDGLHWSFERILEQCRNEYGRMWECPDTFMLGDRRVILISPQDMTPVGLEFHSGNGTVCLIGTDDPEGEGFVREGVQAVDYGIDFYAPQTILTPDGRRVMIAWMQNWDTCAPREDARWFGQMTVPRELSLRNGRLYQLPIRELEALHGRRVAYSNIAVGQELTLEGVCGRMVDMTVTIRPSGEGYRELKLKLARDSRHYTLIRFEQSSTVLTLDRRYSGSCHDFVHLREVLIPDSQNELKLRILLDRFSVELFVNDGAYAVTTTIDTPMTADGISFEADGELTLDVEKYELIK